MTTIFYDALEHSPTTTPQLNSLRKRPSESSFDIEAAEGSRGDEPLQSVTLSLDKESDRLAPAPVQREVSPHSLAFVTAESVNDRDGETLASPTETVIDTPPTQYVYSLLPSPPYQQTLPPSTEHSPEVPDVAHQHSTSSTVLEPEQGEKPHDDLPVSKLEKFTLKWPIPVCVNGNQGETHARKSSYLSGIVEFGRELRVSDDTKWTWCKLALLFSVLIVLSYGITAFVWALMTWFRTWNGADVLLVAEGDLLIVITLTGSFMIFASLVGIFGLIINSRRLLAVYALLLWPTFIFLLAVGYMSYKKATFSLDHKLNQSWSRFYTSEGRKTIQNALGCCGYYSSLHQGSASKQCYSRSPLPGCKASLWRFERLQLNTIWMTAFSVVPLHVLNIFVALICANHITSLFARRMLPPMYRLTNPDVKVEAERLLSQDCRLFSGSYQKQSVSKFDEKLSHEVIEKGADELS